METVRAKQTFYTPAKWAVIEDKQLCGAFTVLAPGPAPGEYGQLQAQQLCPGRWNAVHGIVWGDSSWSGVEGFQRFGAACSDS